MDTSNRPVISPAGSRTHRRHSDEFKRSIVEQSFQPGVSVARLARANGINANQVFAWRKLFRESQCEAADDPSNQLLPVSIAAPDEAPMVSPSSPSSTATAGSSSAGSSPPGVLRLEFSTVRLTIEGTLDMDLVRAVLGCLPR